jgi:FKBP-type peptidyl-prolyl cis-trans isomerase
MKISKITTGLFFALAAIIFLTACTEQSGSMRKEVSLDNDLDSVSYAIGLDIATNLKKSGFDEINSAAIAKGFDDVFGEVDPLMEPASANQYVMNHFTKVRAKKGDKNLKEAEAFLTENETKEGVQTTESGLQFKILTEGNGPIPTETDMVTVNYRGTLIDGTEFDASKEGNPAQFRVNGVIKGWTEALTMMPVGSKWELYIHPNLGYGENPRGGTIEPNDLLIFEVELLEIVKK